MPGIPEAGHHGQANFITGKVGFFSEDVMVLTAINDVKGLSMRIGYLEFSTYVICKGVVIRDEFELEFSGSSEPEL